MNVIWPTCAGHRRCPAGRGRRDIVRRVRLAVFRRRGLRPPQGVPYKVGDASPHGPAMARMPSSDRIRAATGLAASVPALVLAFLAILAFLLGRGRADALYNSDVVHVFLLVQDLLRDPAALLDWHHSPAIYVVPDWLIAALPVIAGVPDAALPLAHGALLLTLYSLSGGALVAAAGRVPPLAAVWGVAAALAASGGIAFLSVDHPLTPVWYAMLAAPFTHSGATLMTLVCAALLLALLSGRAGKTALAALAVAVFAAAFSDFLFLPWFVGPACIVALLAARSGAPGNGRRCAGVVAAAAVAAVLAERLVRAGGGIAGYMPTRNPLDAVATFVADILSATAAGDLFLLAILALAVALWVRAAFLLLVLWRGAALPPGALTDLFLAGSCAAAVLAPLATGTYLDVTSWRYFLAVFLLVLLWVVDLAFRRAAARRAGPAVPGLLAALVLGAAAAASVPALDAGKRLASPGPLAACLAGEDRNDGLGDYWTAKRLMLASGRAIHIVQVNDTGSLYRWNYNDRWFHRRTGDGAPVRPDFIVLDNLDAGLIAHRFGPPARALACGGSEVWLYDRPLDVSPDVSAPGGAVFAAAGLPGNVGSVRGSGRAAEEGGDGPGHLTYGPYVDVPAGRYAVTIVYAATGNGHGWDIAHGTGPRVMARGELPATGGEVRELSVSLDTGRSLAAVEVRTRFGGTGTLSVHEIRLRPE